MKKTYFFLCVQMLSIIFISTFVSCSKIDKEVAVEKTDRQIETTSLSGGQPVQISSRPYQVWVRIQKGTQISQGGGSILNSRWIVTAAHLFDGAPSPYVGQVWSGSTSVEATTFDGEAGTIDSVVIHPNWDGHTDEFDDIALVRLSEPLTFDANCRTLYYMNPVYTNEMPYQDAGKIATVSGWGETGSGSSEAHLRSADMEILSKTSHKIPPYPAFPRSDKLIYTFTNNSTVKAIGSGDSGGPLTVNVPGLGDVLVGVASFSGWPDAWNLPSAFTRVSEYANWIQNVTDIGRPKIIGPYSFCNSANYTVKDLLFGSTVNWSVSNPSLASLTINGNNVTVNKLANGPVNLIADINVNGTTTTLTTSIFLGPITQASVTVNPNHTRFTPSSEYNFIASEKPGCSYQWVLSPVGAYSPGDYTLIAGPNGGRFTIYFNTPGRKYALKLKVTNECGTAQAWSKTINVLSDDGTQPNQ